MEIDPGDPLRQGGEVDPGDPCGQKGGGEVNQGDSFSTDVTRCNGSRQIQKDINRCCEIWQLLFGTV